MVRLEDNKFYTEEKKIEVFSVPGKVCMPLSQHLGKACDPIVNINDLVSVGQKIGTAQAHVFSPVHASISGKVSSITDWPHPVLGRAKAVVIDSDGTVLKENFKIRSPKEIEGLSIAEIRNIVFDSGIVGMGGASFPSHIKLTPAKPVDTLIINGAECEPFLTADYRLMLEKKEEVLKGAALAARCLGIKRVVLAIEDNKPRAIKEFEPLLGDYGFSLKVLKSSYPQGGEKQLIKSVLNKEVPRGKLPFDVGVVVHNVATIFAIYEAVYLGKPLYERVITVTGSCLHNPKNLLVRIGTPIAELIKFCGLKEEPAKIIMGGPMMGIAQYTDQVPVIKSSNGVLLLTKEEAECGIEDYCIRCGACVRECPSGLMPCLINLASEKGLWSEAKDYGALDCIECGVCNYLCPANRLLVQSIKRAKLEAVK